MAGSSSRVALTFGVCVVNHSILYNFLSLGFLCYLLLKVTAVFRLILVLFAVPLGISPRNGENAEVRYGFDHRRPRLAGPLRRPFEHACQGWPLLLADLSLISGRPRSDLPARMFSRASRASSS